MHLVNLVDKNQWVLHESDGAQSTQWKICLGCAKMAVESHYEEGWVLHQLLVVHDQLPPLLTALGFYCVASFLVA